MTNQFTGEQIEAAADAAMAVLRGAFAGMGEPWTAAEFDQARGMQLKAQRAALEAAAGVAPQAPGEATEEALAYLEHLREQGHIGYVSYASLHDHITAIAASVQPSSTVNDSTCPNCFQPRGGADWHTLWSGGFTCERIIPHTVGDIIPDANGQKMTTEHGYYSGRLVQPSSIVDEGKLEALIDRLDPEQRATSAALAEGIAEWLRGESR